MPRLIILLSCLLLVAPASAQLVQPTHTLTLEGVKTIVAAAEAEALANDWNVIVAIVDAGGHLLFFERMDGVQLGSIEIAQQKARSAVLYKRPTKAFADRLGGGNMSTLNIPGAMTLEGGLPIVVDGQVIGGIGVSGVRSEDDARIGQAGIDALLAAIDDD